VLLRSFSALTVATPRSRASYIIVVTKPSGFCVVVRLPVASYA
jgi:hypothetical protein